MDGLTFYSENPREKYEVILLKWCKTIKSKCDLCLHWILFFQLYEYYKL